MLALFLVIYLYTFDKIWAKKNSGNTVGWDGGGRTAFTKANISMHEISRDWSTYAFIHTGSDSYECQ